MADEPRLAVAARRKKRRVAVIVEMGDQLSGLALPVTEVLRPGVSGRQEGIRDFHAAIIPHPISRLQYCRFNFSVITATLSAHPPGDGCESIFYISSIESPMNETPRPCNSGFFLKKAEAFFSNSFSEMRCLSRLIS